MGAIYLNLNEIRNSEFAVYATRQRQIVANYKENDV